MINNVALGQPDLTVETDINGTNGHTIHGYIDEAPADWDGLGFNVLFSDVNCDGEDDIVISAPWNDSISTTVKNNGRLYVL